jgi:hypothetical protein
MHICISGAKYVNYLGFLSRGEEGIGRAIKDYWLMLLTFFDD